MSVATFATYSLTGHNLTPAKAFVGISLFNILSFPLAMLPMLVMFLVEVRVSLKRILSFLQNDELDSEAVTRVDSVALDVTKDEDVVVVKNGNFNWSRDERIILQEYDYLNWILSLTDRVTPLVYSELVSFTASLI